MKKFLACALSLSLIGASAEENIDQLATETDALWRTGAGGQDGAYTSLALSMLGWGLGLAVGIGILAAVLHSSTASTAHDQCTH